MGTTTFSIGVSKKYLATLLDCVIQKNDQGWARLSAITGAILIWIGVALVFVGYFIIPGDPRDVALGSMIFLIIGITELGTAVFFRLSRGYLMRSESVLVGFQTALVYLDGMALVRKCQEVGTEPPKDVLDRMQQVQKRYGIPYFNQERDGADEIIVTERFTTKS